MKTFTIDKNVPRPEDMRGTPGGSKYPFAKMKVGDSFSGIGSLEAVRAAVSRRQIRCNKLVRFSVQKTTAGFRCWRVA